MSDIFQEVDEEFKRDKVAQFLKKHGNLLIGLALAIVLSVAAYRIYNYFELKKAAEAGQKFEAALALSAEGKEAEARAMFEALAKDAPAGYQALSQFKMAADLAKTDKAAAAQAFDRLGTNAGLDPMLRDLAKVRAGLMLVDSASLADLQQRLEPLAAPGQAWRLAAREGLAAAALKAKDFAKAEQYLMQILGDPDTSRSVRERAEVMMSLVRGAQAGK
jgi:hypothetical protein